MCPLPIRKQLQNYTDKQNTFSIIFHVFNTLDSLDIQQSVIYDKPDSSQNTPSRSTDGKYNSFMMAQLLCTDTRHIHAIQQQPSTGNMSTKKLCTQLSYGGNVPPSPSLITKNEPENGENMIMNTHVAGKTIHTIIIQL